MAADCRIRGASSNHCTTTINTEEWRIHSGCNKRNRRSEHHRKWSVFAGQQQNIKRTYWRTPTEGLLSCDIAYVFQSGKGQVWQRLYGRLMTDDEPSPENTRSWTTGTVVLMLGHRRRRWTSIKITLVQCLVFTLERRGGLFDAVLGPIIVPSIPLNINYTTWCVVGHLRRILPSLIYMRHTVLPISKAWHL